jgi:hypothetical protein
MGLLPQIAHHLMTWGPTVTILAPESLKDIMWEQVEALHAHHRPTKKGARNKAFGRAKFVRMA